MKNFSHVYRTRVRTYQADRQNVLHNAWYIFLFEEARVEYIRKLGFQIDRDVFITHDKFFVAHNSVDYRAPAFYDDEVEIGTRIVSVGDTSITFEHEMWNLTSGALCASARHVLVHVNSDTNQPETVPAEMRALIHAAEPEASIGK